MEAKLAEFRKKQAQTKPLINWEQIFSRFKSFFSFLNKKSSVQKNEDLKEEEEKEETNWKIILIKCLLWLTLYYIFIRIEFGTIYLIISLLYLIWYNLGNRRKNELSAYSVFNPKFEKIQGTFSAEDYDKQLRRGGSTFFS